MLAIRCMTYLLLQEEDGISFAMHTLAIVMRIFEVTKKSSSAKTYIIG